MHRNEDTVTLLTAPDILQHSPHHTVENSKKLTVIWVLWRDEVLHRGAGLVGVLAGSSLGLVMGCGATDNIYYVLLIINIYVLLFYKATLRFTCCYQVYNQAKIVCVKTCTVILKIFKL